ncbi:hypothetical protein AMQ83_12620, partial [Paenibacillus riograndensis]
KTALTWTGGSFCTGPCTKCAIGGNERPGGADCGSGDGKGTVPEEKASPEHQSSSRASRSSRMLLNFGGRKTVRVLIPFPPPRV